MGDHLVFERYFWFDRQVRDGKYPNAVSLARQFGITPKTGQRNIDRMRMVFDAPLTYDSSRKGYSYTDEGFSLLHHQVNQEELLAILLARNLLTFSAGGVISDRAEPGRKKRGGRKMRPPREP